MKEFADRLIDDFADKEYAHAYMDEHSNTVIAAQIKALREQRGLTQAQLAELAGMKQERVSALENVEYDAWTAKTLRKLAGAFDVHLKIAFAPFSEGIMDVVNLSRERLHVAPREQDLASFRNRAMIERENQWKAIDTDHLAEVKVIYPSKPLDPTKHRWQILDVEVRHG